MAIPRMGLVLLCLLFVTPVAPAPANATATTSTRAPATYVADIQHFTNDMRTERDRVGLHRSPCLERMAEVQARKMARRGALFHQDLGRVQRNCGMGYVGENVAFGFDDGKDVVKGWMASSGHRANLLRPPYRVVGSSAVWKDGGWWVSQLLARRS